MPKNVNEYLPNFILVWLSLLLFKIVHSFLLDYPSLPRTFQDPQDFRLISSIREDLRHGNNGRPSFPYREQHSSFQEC
jgi:hypothetical protein